MKRRISDSGPRNPSQTWTHPHARRSFNSIRSFGATTSRGHKDTSCRKRVKFTDNDYDNPLSCRPGANSIPSQVTRATKSGDPKTSEYAFFKQLKEDAGHVYDSQSVHKEGNQPNTLRSSYCLREKANQRSSYDDSRSLLNVENVSSVKSDSFFSPVIHTLEKPEVYLKNASTMLGSTGSMQENVKGCAANNLKPGGTKDRRVDIFSRKREKLRQWVMNASIPEIDELCSNGYDFVSVLLGRLIPKSNEDNSFKPPKSRQVDIDAKSKLVASSESDTQCKKLYQITGNFIDVDNRQLFEDGLPSYGSDRSREMLLSDSDSPICHAYKTHRQDITIREPDCRLGGRATISCTEFDSDCDFSFEKYNSFPWHHIDERHEFRNPNRYLLGREPQALLLGWDFDSMTKERNSSNTCQNLELIPYPTSSSLWDDDQQLPDDGDAASWLSTSPDLPSCSSDFCSFLQTQLASSHNHYFGRHIPEENDKAVSELNHFPLTLWNGPDYPNLDKNHNHNNICEGSRISLSPQNHNWFVRRFLPERHYLGMERYLLSPGLENSGWKYLSITGPGSSSELYSSTIDDPQFPQKGGISSHFLTDGTYEGFLDDAVDREAANKYSNILNIHDISTYYFQASLTIENAYPSTLDKSYWDELQGEKSIDDDDDDDDDDELECF